MKAIRAIFGALPRAIAFRKVSGNPRQQRPHPASAPCRDCPGDAVGLNAYTDHVDREHILGGAASPAFG